MSTPEFEVHRAIVHSSNITTGAAEVRIPSLLGAGQVVSVPTTGLTLSAGEWNVPSAGSSVFVAVSADRTQFLWLTGVTVPTDSDIDFNDNVTIGGDLTVGEGTLRINRASGTQAASAGNIIFQVDGSNWASIQQDSAGLLRIGSSTVWFDGSVGVGTASPSYNFHVKNDSSINAAIESTIGNVFVGLKGTGETAFDKVGIGTNGSDGLELHAGDSARLVIDSSGNVGIGTTSPTAKLDIQGDSNDLWTTNGWRDSVRIDNGGILRWAIGPTTVHGIGQSGNNLYFGRSTTEDASSAATTYTMVLDSSGRVGINDTTPSYTLDVNGTGRFTGNVNIDTDLVVGKSIANGNATIQIMAQSGYYPIMYFGDGGTNQWHYEATPGGGRFDFVETGAAARLSIKAGGYVGINTTNPAKRLHVVGDVQVDGTLYQFSPSDERLKKNIEQYSGGLSLVRQFNPVTYVWDCDEIDDSGDTKIGLIAQEVEAVRPEWVSTIDERVLVRNSDGQEVTDISAISLLGPDVQAIMISAIKELADRLDEVSARLATLEGS